MAVVGLSYAMYNKDGQIINLTVLHPIDSRYCDLRMHVCCHVYRITLCYERLCVVKSFSSCMDSQWISREQIEHCGKIHQFELTTITIVKY